MECSICPNCKTKNNPIFLHCWKCQSAMDGSTKNSVQTVVQKKLVRFKPSEILALFLAYVLVNAASSLFVILFVANDSRAVSNIISMAILSSLNLWQYLYFFIISLFFRKEQKRFEISLYGTEGIKFIGNFSTFFAMLQKS